MDFFIKSTLALIVDEFFFKYCLVYFFLPSTHRHSLKEPYMAREPMVSEQTVEYQSVEQNGTQP